MRKAILSFIDGLLSKEQMKKVKGGCDNPLWCGPATYSCYCHSGGGSYTAHMSTAGDKAVFDSIYCGGSGSQCSC